MIEQPSNIDQNYLLGYFKFKTFHFYLVRIKDTAKNIWTSKTYFQRALSVCKLKVLQLIHQNKHSKLNKRQFLKTFIQEIKKYPLSITSQKIILKFNNQINQQKHSQLHIFKSFFDSFRLPLIITPYIWKKCYRLIKQPQLFEVVGRIYNKKSGYFYYLIKFKYSNDHEYLFWTNSSSFNQHPAKIIINAFNDLNPKNKKILIDKRYSRNKIQFIKNFQKQLNIQFTVLGKAKIREKIFYLRKLSQQTLQNSQWNLVSLFMDSKRKKFQINNKILEVEHNLDKSPFIDRQNIKKIIQQQTRQNETKYKNKQRKNNFQSQDIEKLIELNVNLFMKKFQQLKREVQTYFEGIQIFDQSNENVQIQSLRKKMNSITNQLKFSKVNNQKQSIIQQQNYIKKETLVKQQLLSEANSNSEEQGEEQYDNQRQEVKIQNSMVEIQYVAEQQSLEDFQDFYEKIKKQCKEEHTESLFLENERKKSLKSSRSSFKQKTSKKIEKKLKKQRNLQTTFYDDQSEVKREQFNTSTQSESETLKTKDQSEVEKKDFQQAPKIRKLQKFLNSTNCSDIVYRVHFIGGKIVFCTKSELIEKQGLNRQMIQNIETNV